MTRNTGNPKSSRETERIPLTAEVLVRRSGVHGFRGNVFDATPEGCKVEFVERPLLGERVWVKFDGLEVLAATVRWIDGHIGGVQFERPLHEAVFLHLVSNAPDKG